MAQIFQSELYNFEPVDLGTSLPVPQIDYSPIASAFQAQADTKGDQTNRMMQNLDRLGQIQEPILNFRIDNLPQQEIFNKSLERVGLSDKDFEDIDLNDPRAVQKVQRKVGTLMRSPEIRELMNQQAHIDSQMRYFRENPQFFQNETMNQMMAKDMENYFNSEGDYNPYSFNIANYVPVDWMTATYEMIDRLPYDTYYNMLKDDNGEVLGVFQVKERLTDDISRGMGYLLQTDPRYKNTLKAQGLVNDSGEFTELGRNVINEAADIYANRVEGQFIRTNFGQRRSNRGSNDRPATFIDLIGSYVFPGNSNLAVNGRQILTGLATNPRTSADFAPRQGESNGEAYERVRRNASTIRDYADQYGVGIEDATKIYIANRYPEYYAEFLQSEGFVPPGSEFSNPEQTGVGRLNLRKENDRYFTDVKVMVPNGTNVKLEVTPDGPEIHYSQEYVTTDSSDPKAKQITDPTIINTYAAELGIDLNKYKNKDRTITTGEKLPLYRVIETQKYYPEDISNLPSPVSSGSVIATPSTGAQTVAPNDKISFRLPENPTQRTDKHNNLLAITTDVAKQAGVPYEVGEDFPEDEGGDDYQTAILIGDPIDVAIDVIDRIGFFTQDDGMRWNHEGTSREQYEQWQADWPNMSRNEKIQVIATMYEREGGDGQFVIEEEVVPGGIEQPEPVPQESTSKPTFSFTPYKQGQ